jgi:hypothetical protein
VCLPNRTTKTTDKPTDEKEHRSDNTGLAKVAVQCSADTFVVNQSLVLRINICGENRHLRQARNRIMVFVFKFILFFQISKAILILLQPFFKYDR